MRRLLAALAVTALIAVLAVPSTALAGPSSSLTAASRPCPINVAGYRGYYICGTDKDQVSYASGPVRRRVFVIGTNHAVWNIAEYRAGGATGWRSLGGWAQIGVYIDYYSRTNSSVLGISVWGYGFPPNPWCRDLYHSWGRWYRCG